MPTKIQWCDEVWNPITGCTPVSPGCANCYAARMAKRLAGRFGYPKGDGFAVTGHGKRLVLPSKWARPRNVFVNSMGDLFHEQVEFGNVRVLMEEMQKHCQHTYMILTKRPERMKEFFDLWDPTGGIVDYANIWLGVTAENQKMAEERIKILQSIPCAIRFVSVEPQLEEVNLQRCLNLYGHDGAPCCTEKHGWHQLHDHWVKHHPTISWVICGAESGPKRRPFDMDWARSLRDQCQAAGVPFFFKQGTDEQGKIVHMPELDGVVHAERPVIVHG